MPKKYKINSHSYLLKDEDSTKFHVNSDDYFGTIATILDLLEQEILSADLKKEINEKEIEKTFSNLKGDLLFLQKNYTIKIRNKNKNYSNPRIKNKNNKPKGRLKSQ